MKPSNTTKMLGSFHLIGLAVLTILFFLTPTNALIGQGGGMPPVAVGVIEAQLTSFPVNAQYYGLVEGRTLVDVYSEVSGRIHTKAFEEGVWVEKGQILYEIDGQSAGAMVHQGEAGVDEAQVRLDYAESQLVRMTHLFNNKAVSQQEFETAQRERDLALSNLNAAKAGLEQIRTQAALSTITAPVSGYVGMAQKSEGELVAPGSRETAYMTTVEDMSAVKVNFFIPESHVRRYRALARDFGIDMESLEHFPATLTVDGESYLYPGQMEYGSARIERGTGVMAARASFPNPSLELYSGQVVRLDIEILTLKDVFAIPQTAFIHSPNGLTLAVLTSDNLVEYRSVPSHVLLNGAFILKNDGLLNPGDSIVVEGLPKTQPGQPVQPTRLENPLTSPPAGQPAASAKTS
jgi:membrane fusion protein (multidrug efflux system)